MRKPAFNHPDHAGLIATSNVTSLTKQPKNLLVASYSSYGVLSFCCHPDMSLCRATIMRHFAVERYYENMTLYVSIKH